MPDRATSSHRGVQAQLDRLAALSPRADILGLERITALLDRLGDPHRRLPAVFHVAGTNGKGSTCAFLRAALEAAGLRVHVYTSPHLVRFNERVRIAGQLIGDEALAALLGEALDVADGIGASFFEITTAAALLAFSRVPADACVIEVGLGGRLDATNVVTPTVCGIAQLGIDHQAFLGDTIEAIAGEKAGIAKPGVPLVTMAYSAPVAARVAEVASARNAPVLAEGEAWRFSAEERLRFQDGRAVLELPSPALAGPHQAGNYALAVAMLRHQRAVAVPEPALAAGAGARWPARMQRLGPGPLTAMLSRDAELWIDGGHNPAAADAIAAALTRMGDDRPLAIVLGMLANKDAGGLLDRLAPHAAALVAVPTPGHEHHTPALLARLARDRGVAWTETARDLPAALALLADRAPGRVLIAGSLYLAGEALRLNDELPT